MVYNTLDVLGAALALGISLKDSAAVLAKVPHVQGRVEVVPTPGKDYTCLLYTSGVFHVLRPGRRSQVQHAPDYGHPSP